MLCRCMTGALECSRSVDGFPSLNYQEVSNHGCRQKLHRGGHTLLVFHQVLETCTNFLRGRPLAEVMRVTVLRWGERAFARAKVPCSVVVEPVRRAQDEYDIGFKLVERDRGKGANAQLHCGSWGDRPLAIAECLFDELLRSFTRFDGVVRKWKRLSISKEPLRGDWQVST